MQQRNPVPFFERDQPSCRLYHADCLQIEIPASSVDLIVTSPPYNLDIAYASYEDSFPYKQYLQFSHAWLSRCFEWLKPDGRLCLNVPLDTRKMGNQSVGADLAVLAKQVGYQYHSTIVWNEGTVSRRTAWGSWCSASAPYVTAPVELVIVLYKHEWVKQYRGESDITPQEFLEWTNGLWTFPGESARRIGHPAPFPVELPKRCIKLFSYVGDTVLDPFCGSGTTLLVAMMLNRCAIGIEPDQGYCQLAIQRIMEHLQPDQLRLDL